MVGVCQSNTNQVAEFIGGSGQEGSKDAQAVFQFSAWIVNWALPLSCLPESIYVFLEKSKKVLIMQNRVTLTPLI